MLGRLTGHPNEHRAELNSRFLPRMRSPFPANNCFRLLRPGADSRFPLSISRSYHSISKYRWPGTSCSLQGYTPNGPRSPPPDDGRASRGLLPPASPHLWGGFQVQLRSKCVSAGDPHGSPHPALTMKPGLHVTGMDPWICLPSPQASLCREPSWRTQGLQSRPHFTLLSAECHLLGGPSRTPFLPCSLSPHFLPTRRHFPS